VRDFGPDVVLLDIGMPQISGYEVARALRERYASARPLLVAITGHSKPTDRTLAQLAGFDHHFAKPYDSNALLALLRVSGAATRSREAPEIPGPAARRDPPARR
jgi:two-component system CheB/CheR fusion protein